MQLNAAVMCTVHYHYISCERRSLADWGCCIISCFLLSSAASSRCSVLLHFHHERAASGLFYYHCHYHHNSLNGVWGKWGVLVGWGSPPHPLHFPFWHPRRNARTVHDYLCCHETLRASPLFILFLSLLISAKGSTLSMQQQQQQKKWAHFRRIVHILRLH